MAKSRRVRGTSSRKQSRLAVHAGRRLLTEQLEPRRMLSVTATSYRYTIGGTGADPAESVLTPTNVVSTANGGSFGKKFSVNLDGQVLAQPLYMSQLTITAPGGTGAQNIVFTAPNTANTVHDVVFLADEHDSLYAIDADNGTVLWQDSFINGTTITTVPSGDVNSGDITPEIGITGTPAIDPATNSLFVIAETKQIENGNANAPHYLAVLYKVDIQNGTDTSIVIADTTDSGGAYTYNTGSPYVVGTGDGSINVSGQNRVYFNALRQMFRPGVLLYNGQVILGSASHGDNGPYHGWMLTYNESSLALTGVLNTTPNGGLGGIWQGDGAIVVDEQGSYYFETGNGSFNQNSSNFPVTYSTPDPLPIDGDYGDSFVKVGISSTTQANPGPNGWGLQVVDYFTPEDQGALNSADEDLGSGGPMILPDSAGSTAHPYLLLGGGKEGKIYLLDREHMGGFSTTDAGAVQTIGGAVGGILSVPAYFNGEIYYTGGYSGGIDEYSILDGVMSTSPVSTTPDGYGNLDGGPIITSDGSVNGVVWALDRGSNQLRAYSAANLQDELYTSAQVSADQLSSVVSVMKYTTPMVANGQVYVGIGNALVVYGLQAAPTQAPSPPTGLTATAVSASSVELSWSDPTFNPASNASVYDVERSSDGGSTWTQIGQAASEATSYADTTAVPLTEYEYRVRAANAIGTSAYAPSSAPYPTVTTPGAQTIGAGDGLLGQYYSGIDINYATATPSFTRVDSGINFNWNSSGPGGTLGTAGYSVQWSGEVQAQYTEAYTFTTTSDDGIRVFVNGTEIINDFVDQGATTTNSQPIQMTAGESATIVVQYYQDTGGAEAILDWSSPSTPKEVIPQSQLFSGSAPAAPVLATPVAASGTQINLSWTESSNFENGFEIDRKTGAGGTYSTIAVVNPTVTTYMDTGLVTNTLYYYRVRALNFVADSPYSNEQSLLAPTLPATPSGAHPTSITTTQIAFSWINNADNGTVTRILRNPSAGGNFIFVAALPPTTMSYIDNGPGGNGLIPGNTYDYHIQVGNIAGYSDFTGFTVQTLTIAPTELVAVGGDAQVTLAWNEPTGAQSFNIYRSTSSNGPFTEIETGVVGDTYLDTGLTNGTTYYYEVSSVDTGGESALSSQASATPLVPTAKALPPTDLTATSGDTTASLQWIAAEGAASYNVYRAIGDGPMSLVQSGITITSFGDSGLTNNTTYNYQVTSVNSFGEGTPTSPIAVTPHTLPPPTPINVTATAGNGQVGLSWTAASDASSYNIYRSTDSGDEVLYQQGVVGTTFNDTGVTNGVTYYYQVSAANGVGESNLSIEVLAEPLPPLPGAPTSLVATALNYEQIGLQWHENASSLTGYQVLRSPNDINFSVITTLDPSATSYTDSGNLATGITYYYQVVAMNVAGSSGDSNTAHAVLVGQIPPSMTDADIGGPALAGSATFNNGVATVSGGGSNIWYSSDQFNYLYQGLSGDGTIIAQVLTQGNTNPWAMAGVMIRNSVASAGSTFADMMITPGNGAALQYRAVANTSNLGNDQVGGEVPDWVELTRTGSTITGYISTDGTSWTEVGSYTFAAGALGTQVYIGLAVSAWNNSKLSTATFDNFSISGQAAPVAPTNLTANAVSGTSAVVQWQDSDPSIYTYDVYRENPGASHYTQIATLPHGVTSFTDTGLTSGDAYSYQVVATNTINSSSAVTTSVTLPTLPQPPSLLQPNSVTANSAGLSWVLNSSDDTNVDVYRREGNATSFTLIATLPAGSTAYNDSSLQSGTVYEYQVSAVNLAGQSDFADTGFTTLPAAPTGVSATAGTNGITVQWSTATGALIYNVYRGLTPGGEGSSPYASGLTSSVFVDNGVNPGTTYYYTVTAADFTGESVHSAEVHVGATSAVVVAVSPVTSGTDSLVVSPGTDLTVDSILQTSIIIGAGATLTIAPSGPGISVATPSATNDAQSAVAAGDTAVAAPAAAVAAPAAIDTATSTSALPASTALSTPVATPLAVVLPVPAAIASTAPAATPAIPTVATPTVASFTTAGTTPATEPVAPATLVVNTSSPVVDLAPRLTPAPALDSLRPAISMVSPSTTDGVNPAWLQDAIIGNAAFDRIDSLVSMVGGQPAVLSVDPSAVSGASAIATPATAGGSYIPFGASEDAAADSSATNLPTVDRGSLDRLMETLGQNDSQNTDQSASIDDWLDDVAMALSGN